MNESADRRRNEQIMVDTKIFNEILGLLQADMPPEKTYKTVCALVKQAVLYESATLFMYNEETQKMNPVYQSGEEIVDLLSSLILVPGQDYPVGYRNKKIR